MLQIITSIFSKLKLIKWDLFLFQADRNERRAYSARPNDAYPDPAATSSLHSRYKNGLYLTL